MRDPQIFSRKGGGWGFPTVIFEFAKDWGGGIFLVIL